MFSFLVLLGVAAVGFTLLLLTWLTLRFIPNNCVGVVGKDGLVSKIGGHAAKGWPQSPIGTPMIMAYGSEGC